MKSFREIEQIFAEYPLSAEQRSYLHVHSKRYAYLLKVAAGLRARISAAGATLLDIGPSFFTELLSISFPQDRLLALGLNHPSSRGGHLPDRLSLPAQQFIQFDLNLTGKRAQWVQVPSCDMVIMAEVIEHLHVAAELVLQFIRSFLNPGGFLIIQTPNAAALNKRLKLLLGRNPYAMIRENSDNPGHFHEYTRRELLSLASRCRLNVVDCHLHNYFNSRNSAEKIYMTINSAMPPAFRDGITLILRKPQTETR